MKTSCYAGCILFILLLSQFVVQAQMEGAAIRNVQACGSATLVGIPVWGTGAIHPATLFFEQQVGTNWVTINTQVYANGSNYIIITPSDISSATQYRLRARDENTGQEFTSVGVTVNPATWNGTIATESNVSASANWGSTNCSNIDDYLLVEPEVLPGGRPPFRIEYRKAIDVNFTEAAAAALWAAIYNIEPNTEYIVRVTDFCGKVTTQGALRLRLDIGTYVFDPTTCNNGIVRLSPSGIVATRGIAPFTYAIGKYTDTMTTIRPALTFSSIAEFNNLAPGDYDVQLMDACGNLSTLQSIRLGGGLPRLSIISAALSADSCTQTATVNVFTGTPPFQFGIRGPGATQYTWQANNVFTGLKSTGTYSFKMKDKCGDSSLPKDFSNLSLPSVSTVNSIPTGSSCINHFVVVSSNAEKLGPFDYGIRIAGSTQPYTFQASDTFKHMVVGNYDIVKRNRCGDLSFVKTVYTWTNTALCPVRTAPGDYEAAATQGCTDFTGNDWTDAKDGDGNLVFSINPQGNSLQQVCWGVRIVDGSGNSIRTGNILGTLVRFLDRNIYIQPTVTPSLTKPVLIKFYISDSELQHMLTYLHNNGYPSVTLNDLKVLKKNVSAGSPVDLEVSNDNTAPASQFTIITPVFKQFGFNWSMEFSLNSFSEFNPYVANIVALPLTFLSFTGRGEDDAVVLKWTTSEEVNTRDFDIEWSTDGIHFSRIGNVLSKNAPGLHEYNFTHRQPAPGRNYYRIKQIDKDAQFMYSKVIIISNETKAGINLYPNPVQNLLQVSCHEKITSSYITDSKGSRIRSWLHNGSTVLALPVHHLPPGLYWLTVVTPQHAYTIKFMK